MESGSKKNFFNKRNIIIISVIVFIIALVGIILLLNNNDNNTGKMFCSFNYDYGFADAKIDLEVESNDDYVTLINCDISYNVTNSVLRENFDLFEQEFRKAMSSSYSDRTQLNIERNGYILDVSFIVDYENFDSSDITASEFFGLGSEDEFDKISTKDFIKEVESMDGHCE